MIQIFLVVQILVALALISVVLLQRSEGGGLGIGGGGSGGGMGGFMSGRATANLLTRVTAILATVFMGMSILLAILAGNSGAPRSILDQPAVAPIVGGQLSSDDGVSGTSGDSTDDTSDDASGDVQPSVPLGN